ncbi:MAG: hypothetical protein U1G07_21180 [Verrucomicrobiota bacterium]
MNRWSLAASAPVLLVGACFWLGSAWLCYANWTRGGRRRAALWLESLRFLLITLLALTLLRPEFVQLIERTDRPEIVVLCDASSSMKTRDVVVGDQVISRAEWLALARKAEFWKSLEGGGKIVVQDFAAPGSTNSATSALEATDLNRALETTLQREKNLKAVLLLSDGDWNFGQSPVSAAIRFRERNVPVFAVAVGRETPLPDLVLEDLAAPSYGLFGEQIALPFRIRSYLPREVKTAVTLYDGRREESRKEVVIPAMGELQESILWSPHAVGDVALTLKLPAETDESLTENNELSARLNIRVDTLKVLVVDSLPRWEYRFLRNALARDPGVEMNCMLFHPGLGVGGGRYYLSTFPETKEAISRYDVIFLGDVGIGDGELTEQNAELIKGLVEQQGSGLVFVPGRRNRETTFLRSPLKELVPVVFDEAKPDGVRLQNESTLVLSTAGRRHHFTRCDDDEFRNDELWKQLPGFFWSAAVEKSRPGSEVVAVHSSLRNSWGRMPLLVTRTAGNGKVLFMGTDSAWRWRRGVEDKYHYRFWSQVVRWMAHQRHLSEREGIRLTFTPETPQAGETVFLQSTVFDPGGFPIEDGVVNGKIVSPAGRTERLEFAPVEGGWGVFKSGFTPQEGGKYRIQIVSPGHNRELQTDLTVTQPQLEKQGRPVNAQVLREVAGITQGGSVSFESLDKIVRQITLLPEPKPLEQRIRLWSNPWWGGAILFFLGIYWTGRKLAGMV